MCPVCVCDCEDSGGWAPVCGLHGPAGARATCGIVPPPVRGGQATEDPAGDDRHGGVCLRASDISTAGADPTAGAARQQ